MGALAFRDRVEELTAIAQSQSITLPKRAEILTLHRAGIVRSVNKVIESAWTLRANFIIALRMVPDVNKLLEDVDPNYDVLESKKRLEIAALRLRQPVMLDNNGIDAVVFLNELAVSWAKKSADDGRFVRRLARRAREAGDACDQQRYKVLRQIEEILTILDVHIRQSQASTNVKHKHDDLIDDHLSKYPIAMDYLAR